MINQTMPILGPVVLIINFAIIFMCLRPKHRLRFTVVILGAMTACIQGLTVWMLTFNPQLVRYLGILYIPLVLWLFKGQAFQKLFAFFTPVQLTILTTHVADAIVGATIGYESHRAQIMYICLSLVLMCGYVLIVLRFGRRLFERLYEGGGHGVWALYAFGSFYSYILIMTLNWETIGALLYFFLILFILWTVGVLCYTIINVRDKSEQASNRETLELQMKALREQTDADEKHHAEMELLRNEMLREMGIVMELYRSGKNEEAETSYLDWQSALNEAQSNSFCSEPVLNAVFSRFNRKATEAGIHLYVNSDIPETLSIDTIKLAVIVSNALENAVTATAKVSEPDKRTIRVRLILDNNNIGIEVTNPCVESVEFDDKDLPVTREPGHGIGVRSIAAFADQNDYLLDFSYSKGKFAMRLIMFEVVSENAH